MAKRVAAPRYPVLNLGNVGVSPPRQPALNTQASALAHNDLVAQLKAITDQQAADRAAGRATADQILQASQGGADFLRRSGLAGDVQAQDYARAVAETKSLAGGYTGQLRTDALNAANAAGTALHAIPGNTQPVTADRGGPLANLLYGLQGSLPGQALAAQGLGSVAAARGAIPSALASGQLQALGAVQASNEQAARLDPQIAAAEGKLPGLTQQYLGQLTKQQQAQQNADSLAAYRNRPQFHSTPGGGLYSVDPTTGAITEVRAPTVPEARPFGSAQTGYYTFDAKGNPVQVIPPAPPSASSGGFSLSPGASRYDKNGNLIASRPPSPSSGGAPTGKPHFDSTNSNTNKYRSDQYGNPILRNGKIVPLPGYKPAKTGRDAVPASSSSSSAPTLTESVNFTKSATQIATNAVNGGTDPKGVYHPPVSRDEALQEMRLAGLFADPRTARIAMRALNKAYGTLAQARAGVKAAAGPGNVFGA